MRARSVSPLAAVVAIFGCAGALAACSTILGFESVTLGDADGGIGGDATNGDGPRTDAPMNTDGPTTDSPTGDTGADGACGDTTMDPLNCGRCGHSCLKGMCMASVCQPYAVATGYFGPWDLAVDATTVYFTLRDDNKVYKASKVDGSGATKLADQPDAIVPYAIEVDGTSVYWTNRISPSGEIRKCALAGCPTANTSTLLATANHPGGLLLLGSRILWSSDSDGTVTIADASNGGNALVLFSASGVANPYLLASDTSYVYATDNTSGITRRIPFDAGAAVALSDNGVTTSSGIAVGGGNVYFSGGDTSSGVLWRIAANQFTAGASATSYASSLKQPAGVTVDATNVYWVNTGTLNQNDGSVMMCPLSGCVTPTTLATGQHYPVRIRVDADAVYWTNYGISTSATDGSIWKVAKP